MGFRYAVFGAGMQGTAAAYDLGVFGDAESVVLFDQNEEQAKDAAERVNKLLGRELVTAEELDARDGGAVEKRLRGIHATLSAVPYFFSPSIALAAIHAGSHMCELGGNTTVTKKILGLDAEAKAAGVSIVPDCGLAPGLGNIIACYGMTFMDRTDVVHIRCGGLPQNPKPPLFYKIVFAIVGLTNEYFGEAYFLKDGQIVKVPTFTGLEEIDFDPPVGHCEAFVTSGGTSTCPWTFQGKIKEYDYKTVRYPGHYERFKVMRDLGLLDLEPVDLHGHKVIPRDLFHKVVAPRLAFPDDKDLVVLRVSLRGEKDGHDMSVKLEVMDFEDEKTGFSAMQRTTGWSASIVTIMMARNEVKAGALPLEIAVEPRRYMELFRQRGIRFTESIQRTITGGGRR